MSVCQYTTGTCPDVFVQRLVIGVQSLARPLQHRLMEGPAVKLSQVSLAHRGSQLLAHVRADHACDHEFACLRMPCPYALQTLRSSGVLQRFSVLPAFYTFV